MRGGPTLLLATVCLTSCIGAYREGSPFAAVTAPNGYGVVYAYRPKKALGALAPAIVNCRGRNAPWIYSGAYAAFYAPPGKALCLVGSKWLEVDVSASAPAYIRLENTWDGMQSEIVPPATGENEITDCRLSPGGRARVADE